MWLWRGGESMGESLVAESNLFEKRQSRRELLPVSYESRMDVRG